MARSDEAVADGSVQRGGLLASVSHQQHPIVAGEERVGGESGESVVALGLACVDADLVTGPQCVEHLTHMLTECLTAGGAKAGARAHRRADRGVLGIAESVHHIETGDGTGRCPSDREVEYAAATGGGQLMPVADQRDSCAGLIRDGQQGPGSVLVEHPGLIDQQKVTVGQHGPGCRKSADTGPAAIVVPPEPVLMNQPCRRRGGCSEFTPCDLGSLEGGGGHAEPTALCGEELSSGRKRRGLARSGGAFHHH